MDRPKKPPIPVAVKPTSSLHDQLKHLISDVDGPADLATNPKHMDEFGLDRSQRSKPR
jgi:hypothetical protein